MNSQFTIHIFFELIWMFSQKMHCLRNAYILNAKGKQPRSLFSGEVIDWLIDEKNLLIDSFVTGNDVLLVYFILPVIVEFGMFLRVKK